MRVPELMGAVATAILREEFSSESGPTAQGTLRFVLNLSADQTAAVAHAVLADPFLSDRIDVKLPERHLAGHGLPADTLTSLPATYFRNAACAKAGFLLAEVEHDEEASFHEIAQLGPTELLDRLDLWVRAVAVNLHLTVEHLRWWEKALAGLRDLRFVSLDRFAAYVLRTREGIERDGQPILFALGAALPALRLPRDGSYFSGLKERARGTASAWRTLFSHAQRRRGCLLLKQTPAQVLLSEEDLLAAFERVREVIPDVHHPVVQAFATSPSGWNAQAAAFAECEWEEVRPLFEGLQRARFNLGQETLEFYDERDPGWLSDDDREYLKLLAGRKTTEPTDDDTLFYDSHRNELKDDKKLKSAWDRFIFGRAVEATDFLSGVALSLESLFNRVPAGRKRKLKIRCDRATKKDLREVNADAGLYFAHRYAGLRRLFGSRVSWDVGSLFDFPALVEGWRSSNRTTLNRSTSRSALQLRFVLELETETDSGDVQSCSAQMVWRYAPNTIGSQLPDDWGRLSQHPLLYCRASREFAGAGSRAKTVDLADMKTFVPAYDRDRGSFVPIYKRDRDIALSWRTNLKECRDQGYLAAGTAGTLETHFNSFEAAYSKAISGFTEHGAAGAANLDQLTCFAVLLESVVGLAKGDRNRDLLLKPLLQIGVVPVDGGAPAAIVAPWNPFRLAAMWRKARLVADLVDRLVGAEDVLFGDTRLFFRDVAHDFGHPLHPEVAVIWNDDGPQLLALSDCAQDYSLHEPPVTSDEIGDDTNESPAEGSECVLDLVRRYLVLHPHERANMSVVLFNCDSSRLPQAVVDRIGSLHDDEEDVRCQVLLRHVDADRLREVYRGILATDTSADAYSASEATQDFMARLRISVVADQAPPPDPKDGCPYDIVFSQDVISRHARVEWYAETADPSDIRTLLPSRWSRRRPGPADDLKSAVYLCCPVQSREGWAYLTAVGTLFRGDWDDNSARRSIPVRQLDFRDGRTARIFDETHDLGNWVVNFDELLDRRQLLNQRVRVIRYKQSATQGRNVIISSRAPLGLLRSMILHRLRDLSLDLPDSELRSLADRLIDDANDVSGDIVLRAAKRGESASELIGVVLSRRLVRDELGRDGLFGWYFLDDYAAWMGQREEQLADLLALCPAVGSDGLLRLRMVVTEAKYVDVASLPAKKKESQKQLRDTVKRIEEAVFGDPERLDRESWLARLSDLILDGIRLPAASGYDLGGWRRAMREGRCEIDLRGYSHVFVPSTTDGVDCTDVSQVPNLQGAYQEVYGRASLKRLLNSYWKGESTVQQRAAAGAEHVVDPPVWRKPGSGEAAVTSRVRVRPQVERKVLRTEDPPPTVSTVATATPDANPSAPALPSQSGAWAIGGIAQLVGAPAHAENDDAAVQWLRSVTAAAKGALQQLSLQAKVVDSALTPNSALLKLAGSSSMTVEQVLRKRSELLTSFGLNVISVRPEPGAVVLAIERPSREVIGLTRLWAKWSPRGDGWGNQELVIGVRESDGGLLFLSPGRSHAPHTLIAGSTGSGKSVLMQNIILGIGATNSPEQARILLIDPKQGVDYFVFDELPHLYGGVIDSQEVATSRLMELVDEMDRRYVCFKEARVPNLSSYNAKVPREQRLPTIWLIHDEFAEWMLTEEYKESVASVVQRLGVKARAAGIHLVFAAQRPDVNVMPMQLRANLGNRLILRVDSEGTSEIALGEKGAERLLGRGHLLAKLEGERDLIYAQVPFVDEKVAEKLVRAMRSAASPVEPRDSDRVAGPSAPQ